MPIIVSAQETCNLQVTLLNQDPYPAIPDSYVKLVFQVSGLSDPSCKGARFEILPSYPFSLDTGDALRTLDDTTWTSSNFKSDWMVPYKLRVDADALDGETEIEVRASPGSWGITQNFIRKVFPITIQDARTDFDAVVQDVSGSSVSIALANTGKYAANSVVVRIPEQEGFSAVGTDGQMVGNLASGDYTVVSFELKEKGSSDSKLLFDIYYTDSLGKRRIVTKELPIDLNSNSIISSLDSSMLTQKNQGFFSSLASNWVFWIVAIAVLGLTGWYYWKKRNKRR